MTLVPKFAEMDIPDVSLKQFTAMTTRSNAPASLKRRDKSGYVPGLTIYPTANRH
jgi:hypothetical protein